MGKGAQGLYSVATGNETLTLSGRSQSNGREWVGLELQTTPGTENTRKCQLLYFIFIPLAVGEIKGVGNEGSGKAEARKDAEIIQLEAGGKGCGVLYGWDRIGVLYEWNRRGNYR
jgi:hypothetical protein